MIFGDAFVDFRREFQVFVYVACIWIFRIRADGKLLLFPETQAPSHGLEDYSLWLLLVLSARELSLHPDWGLELKLFEQLVFRKEVSRHHYEYQPAGVVRAGGRQSIVAGKRSDKKVARKSAKKTTTRAGTKKRANVKSRHQKRAANR